MKSLRTKVRFYCRQHAVTKESVIAGRSHGQRAHALPSWPFFLLSNLAQITHHAANTDLRRARARARAKNKEETNAEAKIAGGRKIRGKAAALGLFAELHKGRRRVCCLLRLGST
eukprot:CAMPEP_0206598584 /NCGR_PEP_ID=MMETSP0325_2-20121206/44724_1 /ASSEMBLY_ACC=CAM_ASM_000347 /TAXON_ID=2866 /ORGANISM="Crypthecodinium cohnii, Strain Seligo" /LENGTH=114 /DNA_ID=CAMNT_0054109599 /DNA_START=1370 /DNA_END=1711 /DNA_ORIENTATION=-